MSTVAVIALALLGAIFYFLPSIIASQRNHRNTVAIGVLNLLTGWTLLGWIIALVWACLSQREAVTPPLDSRR